MASDLSAPVFSERGGFHAEPFTLLIGSNDPSVTIHYTLDGSTPNAQSPVYTGQLQIGTPDPSGFALARFRTTQVIDLNRVDRDWTAQLALLGMLWTEPDSVFQGTVVRAMATDPADPERTSPVATRTFFVDPAGDQRFTLPAISLATDPDHFFDHDSGIYIPGAHDAYNNTGRPWHNPGNFKNRGPDWERPVHVELYLPDGELILAQDAGVRIHGGATRNFAQKTLRLYARAEYGNNWFTYPVFPDNKNRRYKRLLLRNSGNDWPLTMIRDAMMQSLVSHLPFDTQSYRPAIVFLNGEFWGIHNIRERFDKHYLSETYGVDPEQVDILSGGGGSVQEGSREHFESLLNALSAGVGSDQELEAISQLMDLENFLHYQLAQIYFNNTDWPGNNIDYWRFQAEQYSPDSPLGHDGRWRWMLYDTDHGFGYAGGLNAASANTLNHAIQSGSNSGFILRTLLENSTFRNRFINQAANHLNTIFRPEYVLARIEAMAAVIEPEIDEHIARWGQPENREVWEQNVEVLRNFARQRVSGLRPHFNNRFDLGGTYQLTVQTNPPKAGIIYVNDMPIHSSTPGIGTNSHPWTGTYFRNNSISLWAQPQAGYRFVGWSNGESSQTLQLTSSENLFLTASFEPDTQSTEGLNPRPHRLKEGSYQLMSWSPPSAAGTYPPNMLFTHVGIFEQDPGPVSNPLSPWLAPYDLENRSRIVGLGNDGIGFINTGNPQELEGTGYVGAAILALDTRDVDEAYLSWTAGTVEANPRPYRITLQYRIGNTLPFKNLKDATGNLYAYKGQASGHSTTFGPIALPSEIIGHPYVQLRWHYHALPSAASGPRDFLRLDNIRVSSSRIRMETSMAGVFLRIEGAEAASFSVERSSDLSEWNPVETIHVPEASYLWPLPLEDNQTAQFFRIIPLE